MHCALVLAQEGKSHVQIAYREGLRIWVSRVFKITEKTPLNVLVSNIYLDICLQAYWLKTMLFLNTYCLFSFYFDTQKF